MNMPRFFMLLCVSVVLIITLNLIQDPSSPWTPVGTGVDYQEFVLAGPVHAYVARMDRTNPNVILESTLAQGKLGGGYETVSDMAERYDQAINFWNSPLAARNNVVIAINGSFVEPDTGAPQSGQIQSGWYVKRFNDYGGGSGFAWKMDRSAFIGECVYHRPEKQLVTVLATGETIPITGINIPRKDNQLIVYTPQYDSDTNTDTSGVEILVEMAKPSQVIPLPRSTEGVVREIRDGLGSTPIPFDSIVLSAAASTREDLLSIVHIGDRIGISQEITSMERDCNTPSVNSWTKTYTSISGSFFFLKNGEIQSYTDDKGATDRHPRTAIAYNDTHIFFIVVDGRNAGHSIGMTIDELALFARDSLAATWGIAQDGGGSSTMLVNGVVRNIPAVPCQMIFAPIVVGQDDPAIQNPPIQKVVTGPDSLPAVLPMCERRVANGMMMVVLESSNPSLSYVPGAAAITNSPTDVRLGPGTNYAVIATLPANTKGIIQDHALRGVFAKGQYWWKVSYSGVTGWVSEQSLSPEKVAPPTPSNQQ